MAFDVGVIIAAYNASSTIERAVRSALADPHAAQVVVVDDASGDDTYAAAQACDDGSGRLTVLRQSANGGPSRARNLALCHLHTEWACVLDADDYFLPGRLGRLLVHADRADLIADELLKRSEAGAEPDPGVFDGAPAEVTLARFVLANISRPGRERAEMGFVKPIMRLAFLRRHSIVYRDALRLGEDYELYARALAHGARMILLPPQGYVAVVRPTSLSGRHSEDDLRRLRDCDRAIASIRTLSPVERRALARHARSVDCKLQWRLLINAVKERNLAAAMATFRSPVVAGYLAARLLEQAWVRSAGRTASRPLPAAVG